VINYLLINLFGRYLRMTDVNALIERWQGGDERAAEALYYHHREQTFRLAYGLLGDQADAEEAAQGAEAELVLESDGQ
jgi:hypothetical protein